MDNQDRSTDGNLLGRETSPYLLQHKDNPVAWRPWGAAALAEAAALDRPVLLSVGYAACHWCHVMAHESFEDPAIASLMNSLFVSIKVDREERPDIDAIYQQALALTGQQGGWPLTMFLTPKGEPFWGGTYFPPDARWGRPGFAQVLTGVAETYRERKATIDGNVRQLTEGLARLAAPDPGVGISLEILDQVAARLTQAFDPVNGGLSGAPKFPCCSVLELVWRGWKRTGDAAMRDAVLLTLERLSQGGIWDHLGGGYARYSTDERWLAPHFEKMLYDNAQLIRLLVWAWQDTGNLLFRERVGQIVDWLQREMLAEPRAGVGAFAATLDADSEGEEGRFYVWDEPEIDRLLGEAAPLFKRFYDVVPHGNWEEKTILNRLRTPDPAGPEVEAQLARSRRILFEAREARIRPARDDKVLADWNGLMIGSLALASGVFDRPDWLRLASDAFAFVTSQMMGDAIGLGADRLAHSWRQDRWHPATLDDYADMAEAALQLHEQTADPAFLLQAIRWTGVVDRHFADGSGSYFLTADDTDALITRTRNAHDSAVPSGNGVMVGVLARLYALTGDRMFDDRAAALIRAFAGEVERNFFPLAGLLNGVELHSATLQIVVIGAPEDPATQTLREAVDRVCLPNRVLDVRAAGENLPHDHPAFGKTQHDGRPTAYVCRGRNCGLPMTEPAALLQQLNGISVESPRLQTAAD